MNTRVNILVFIILSPLTFTPSPLSAQVKTLWTTTLPGIGVYSSPRTADLNQDGIKDIILGAGRLEFERSDTAVIALNGRNGEMLWRVAARDQIFGSACLMNIDKDDVPDVIINGRSAELKAISGKSGELIWEFSSEQDLKKLRESGLYNFYNAQPVPDQDGDGIKDLIVANGGDVMAEPEDTIRPPGKLMLISGKDGKLISQAAMPDGKETYMSIVVAKMQEEDTEQTIIFGSGGETIGGNLYRTPLSALKNGDLGKAQVLASSPNKGFIAPPVLTDINQDGYKDIIANAVEGKILAINGKDNTLLWERKFENTEAYGSVAVGYFNDDRIPDFFSAYARGVWPNLNEARQYMIDGRNGEVLFTDSLGFVQTSSPVAVDFNGDGIDEALMSINVLIDQVFYKEYENTLVIISFTNNQVIPILDLLPGVNLASTPIIDDLDGDGILDIVFCSLTEKRDIFAMNGLRIIRLSTGIPFDGELKWGAYMGSNYDGVFKK